MLKLLEASGRGRQMAARATSGETEVEQQNPGGPGQPRPERFHRTNESEATKYTVRY